MKSITPPEAIGALVAARYRIEEKLGHGGMAAVYRVRDERTGAQVALKRGWSRDRRKLQRNAALLEREYFMLAQLAHPRIIEVYDYGRDADGPYYTMELLDGTDLERAGRLPWRDACAVLCDVASSLAILHSRGVVHRDVSLRNVRYTARGYAKLIDFGAMASIGVANDVVGTPPFTAPEVLQMQALDARADLFSLGALGYHLLTGVHAFPARRFSDLRDAWRSRLPPPSRLAPDVPLELSALVLRLLTLDRGGRPQSAAEVIEQLKTIADLKPEDVAATSRAYLTTPTLVGREQALTAVRMSLIALARSDGGVLRVLGVPGSGRSRLLDACALEGKLLGAAVVRADARDAARGPWGVARALGSQLIELFPKQAERASRLARDGLAHVLEELRAEESASTPGTVPDRSLLVRELREFVLAIARHQRLLIVVDDADRIDDPSAALLAALAHKAERRPVLLALATAVDVDRAQPPALQLLWSLARTVPIEHLLPEQTEELMRSVFGDVPNVSTCAVRIHGLSQGNPRAAMELAQHLVDTGRARYEAGSWALPAVLDETNLPRTLTDSLAARLSELSQDARELVDALVLADGDRLELCEYAALTAHADSKRVFAALDELVSARILIAGQQRYDFAQRGFLSVAGASIGEARRVAIHQRIAGLLAAGDPLRRAHHLLACAEERAAIDLLCDIDLSACVPPVSLLSTAIASAERLGVPARVLHRLRVGLVLSAPFALESEALRRNLPLVIARLERDSGLVQYRELVHVTGPERLLQAIARAQQVHDALSEHERVHDVEGAIRELAQIAAALPSMALPVFDLELLETLPDLSPLLPLSPALQVVAQVIEAARQWLQCRLLRAATISQQLLERLDQPDRGGLEPAAHQRVRLGSLLTLGMFEAAFGVPSAEQRALELEQHREMRVNAWRLRALLQLGLGNPREARKCSRRAELLQAQEGLTERYVRSSAGIELLLYARLGDLLAVKNTVDDLAALAARHRGWRPVELLGRSRYCELQGDLNGALAWTLQALELVPPLRHAFYSALAASHIHLLWELGRKQEAVALAHEHVKLCRSNEVSANDVYLSASLVLAKAGEFGAAIDALSYIIAISEAAGRTGFGMAALHEARARIAIWMNDQAAFDASAARCAAAFADSRNPAFGVMLARLFDEATQRGIVASETTLELQHSLRPPPDDGEYETIHSRIGECVDRADRGHCALTLLLQHIAGTRGHLYVTTSTGVDLVASLPEQPSDRNMDEWVERLARAAFDESDTDMGSSSAEEDTLSTERGPRHPRSRHRDAEGDVWQVRLLFDDRRLAGVLVLPVRKLEQPVLPVELCAKIARELIARGDAEGWSAPP